MPEAARKIRVQCEINGKAMAFEVYPMARLLDVLREQAGLTGTKEDAAKASAAPAPSKWTGFSSIAVWCRRCKRTARASAPSKA